MIALIYESNGGKRLMSGDPHQVIPNLNMFMGEIGTQIRLLDGTALDNVGTALDERLPATVQEFDSTYPGCEFASQQGD